MPGDNGPRDFKISLASRPSDQRSGRSKAIASCLQAAGYCVSFIEEGPLNLGAGEVLLMWGSANRHSVLCRQLAARPKTERPLSVIWHIEPLPPPAASGLPWRRLSLLELRRILLQRARASDIYTNYLRLRSFARKGIPDVLITSTRGSQQFLTERGIAAHWVSLGSDPSYGQDLGLARDIDVLFLGTFILPRRKRLITRLRQQGIDLLAVGSHATPTYWGENRTRLLNRAKILVDLHRNSGELAGMRFLLGMTNGALVISEPVYDPAPYVPGKHYVSAPIEEMPAMIRYYLACEGERVAIASEGHRFVTQEVTLERSLARILQLIRERVPGSKNNFPMTD